MGRRRGPTVTVQVSVSEAVADKLDNALFVLRRWDSRLTKREFVETAIEAAADSVSGDKVVMKDFRRRMKKVINEWGE